MRLPTSDMNHALSRDPQDNFTFDSILCQQLLTRDYFHNARDIFCEWPGKSAD